MKYSKNIWNKREQQIFNKLNTPEKIQAFLDAASYNITDYTYSPRQVIKKNIAHCFDGAMFAAAAIEFNGGQPLIIDLRATDEDDDHILAVYKKNGLFGTVAKSNYVNCRFRDPVYRNLRELALSYFHIYFNLAGTRTLREYSVIFDLSKVTDIDWRCSAEDLSDLGDRVDSVRHFPLIPKSSERIITKADARTYKAETMGVDKRGAFKIKGINS